MILSNKTLYGKKLHPEAIRGIELFNHKEFFLAHEALENAWRQCDPPERDFYRGILQIAVMYYKIDQKNLNGVTKLYHRQADWLKDFPDDYLEVNLVKLKSDTARAFEKAFRNINSFDWSSFKQIEFIARSK